MVWKYLPEGNQKKLEVFIFYQTNKYESIIIRQL